MSLLRTLFGPNKEEIWRQLSSEMGAEFVDGGLWKSDRVEARVGEWRVTLDVYTVHSGNTHIPFTRIRAPYVNADGFRFQVSRSGFFSELGKRLGMQDVEIGDPEFDRDFIIKGNDQARLRSLFSNPTIRDLLRAQPQVHFEVVDDEGWFGADFPEGVDELRFQVRGVITDIARLRRLFDLFAATLDQLCKMGSAYRSAPDVVL